MKKPFILLCYHLGLWGILGFFATLFFGFLTCCANLPVKVFYVSLIVFAVLAILITCFCVIQGCRKTNTTENP